MSVSDSTAREVKQACDSGDPIAQVLPHSPRTVADIKQLQKERDGFEYAARLNKDTVEAQARELSALRGVIARAEPRLTHLLEFARYARVEIAATALWPKTGEVREHRLDEVLEAFAGFDSRALASLLAGLMFDRIVVRWVCANERCGAEIESPRENRIPCEACATREARQ